MEELSFVVGVIGNIISVLVFLSPLDAFWRILKDKSTGDFESVPYICTLLGCSLWTYYGIIRPDSLLVATVNGFGILVESIYIVIFLIYAPHKIKVRTAMLVTIFDVGFLLAAIFVTNYLFQSDARINMIGLIAAGLNIVMYASPLAAMKTVVTTKSVEYMPFFLSFFLFLNGGIWAFYAVLVRDPFLGIPNGTGFIFGSAQLVLYAIYRNAKPSKKNITASLEEGQPQQPLLSPPQ